MKLYEIVFSPTGGTQKVAGFLSKELGGETVKIDLSDYKTDFSKFGLTGEDIVIIAIPSYSGRVPVPAAERLSRIQANGAKAIVVCVYGNRAYEDTLAELQDIVERAGFTVIAAVAAVAEHSIARRYAANRPDQEDYNRLREFARMIRAKLDRCDSSTPDIPGNRPYRKSGKVGLVLKITSACTGCGLCASRCPVVAIDRANPGKVDRKACISCMRCVSVCPHQARKLNGFLLAIVNMMLKKACTVRKENELYI